MIDLDNWAFENTPDTFTKIQNPDAASTFLNFISAKDLCEFISINGRQFQSRIAARFEDDLTYKQWKKESPPLKNTPYYNKYRSSSNSRKCHEAVKKVFSGQYTAKNKNTVDGLANEIDHSPILLPSGQKLFYGTCFDKSFTKLPTEHIFKQFLSCTLCPEVAAYHAISKGGENRLGTLMIIKLAHDVPAIFGAARGKLTHEQELLLKYGSHLEIQTLHTPQNGTFRIVEATHLGFTSL